MFRWKWCWRRVCLSAEHNDLENTINRLPGCLVVAEYKVARKILRYLGLVQNIEENEHPYNSPKKSEGTTFRVKVGDKDLITRNKTTKLIDAINYKMNNWGHYIWIILQLT